MNDFIKELESLINRYSLENDSDTPDFLLANYLSEQLKALTNILKARDEWYGFEPWPFNDDTIEPPKKEKERG